MTALVELRCVPSANLAGLGPNEGQASLLPYMILGFLSPFFRNRLQVCLNLRASDDGTPIP